MDEKKESIESLINPEKIACNELAMKEIAQQLLNLLEEHKKENRYELLVDTLWFLCELSGHTLVDVSTEDINRLCRIAIRSLPKIDRHVQDPDIDVEFRNHLHGLCLSIYTLAQNKEVGADTKRALKKLLDGELRAKPGRPIVWRDWELLDWQANVNADKTSFMLHEKRFSLCQLLNQEMQCLSKTASKAGQATYFKIISCYVSMMLPWFSAAICQQPTATKQNTPKILSPLNPLIDKLLPLLHRNKDALAWELIHIYLYWMHDSGVLPPNLIELEAGVKQQAIDASSLSQSLIILSQCARWVTSSACSNDREALFNLCQHMLKVQQHLIKINSVQKTTFLHFEKYRKKLKKLRGLWPKFPSQTLDKIIKVQQAFSHGTIRFLQGLLKELVTLLGEPPGHFALFILGSSSRQDRLPYSDIELALVYETTVGPVSQLHAYIYTLLSLLEFAVISLGETQDLYLGGDAGFHLDGSDHILSLKNRLIGTVEELYQHHVESVLFQHPGSLVLTGDLGVEGGHMLYALLTPRLINYEWGGKALFSSFKQKVECLLSAPVDAWTQEALKIAYGGDDQHNEKEKLVIDPQIPKKLGTRLLDFS